MTFAIFATPVRVTTDQCYPLNNHGQFRFTRACEKFASY